MTKEQILQKHFTSEFGHDGHGKFMQYILDAMEEYAQQQVKNLNIPAVTNRTFSVDEVKILLEKQKQACANEFIHAEMTMEQAKHRVLNAPTVYF